MTTAIPTAGVTVWAKTGNRLVKDFLDVIAKTHYFIYMLFQFMYAFIKKLKLHL